jgi:hypothetical protein
MKPTTMMMMMNLYQQQQHADEKHILKKKCCVHASTARSMKINCDSILDNNKAENTPRSSSPHRTRSTTPKATKTNSTPAQFVCHEKIFYEIQLVFPHASSLPSLVYTETSSSA